MENFNQLFLHFLKDVYYAERQIMKALPKMVKAAQNPELKKAFELHRTQTQGQIERLQQVFELMGQRAQAVTCEAIQGLIEECEEVIESFKQPGAVRDAGLIACAQAVEHYEMARYTSLVSWATVMGQTEAATLLKQTLNEEAETDTLLGKMANGEVNKEAAKMAA